jgi:signal transduction histidine kinase
MNDQPQHSQPEFHQPFMHHRPPWWPENEPWPPNRRPPWTSSRSGRRKFFWRIGCAFLILCLILGFLFSLALWFIARLAGWVQSPAPAVWVIPLGGLTLLVGLGSLFWVLRRLRWMSTPFGDLLEASERVAAGDYTARVRELGPPEVRSLGKAFNHMASRLQSTDEQRRSLLADISHELRTPLTVVQGNLEGLLDGVYPADETHLRMIFEESQVLKRLIEDLHTLALAESGALQLRREPVDISALINEVISAFNSQVQASSVILQADLPNDLPNLSLDPLRIHQVLSNLIANAIRYTPPEGSISVRGRLISGVGDPFIRLEVSDTGPGIPETDLPYVFDRYYKSSDSGGSGLGLAIARRLVEAHRGTIQASSPAGGGTTIKIELPVSMVSPLSEQGLP